MGNEHKFRESSHTTLFLKSLFFALLVYVITVNLTTLSSIQNISPILIG